MLCLLLACSAPTLGQETESTGPWRDPGISYLEDSKPYAQWILGVLFIAGCALIAVKNPHRTHLD